MAIKNIKSTKARSYRGAGLATIAFPLGGIGTGTVSLGGRGNLQDWELFNRPSKGMALSDSFFAVWARAEGKPPVAAVLEAEPRPPYEGSFGFLRGPVPGLPRLHDAVFSSSYPFARVGFSDPGLPVRISLEAFTPFVPLKDIDSGIPCAIFLWTIRNPGRRKAEVSIAASLLNPIGLDGTEGNVGPGNPAFGGNVNELVQEEHLWAIRMTSRRYQEEDIRHGSMALGTMWPRVSAVTRWPRTAGWGIWEPRIMWDDFAADGTLKGPTDAVPSEQGKTERATMCALAELAPGEQVTVPFLLAWSFPNRVNDWNTETSVRGKVMKNYYTTWFKDAFATLKYVVGDYDRLVRESRSFESTFYGSTLPDAVLESAGNQLATLRSTSCFRDGEGRFFGFEGSGKGYEAGSDHAGCCPLNCSHVWNYAQTTAFLFPELERSARETDFLYNTRDDGNMSFRTLAPVESACRWDFKPAADGQMGTVIRLYREWQVSGDTEWLRKLWPKAKLALEHAWMQWDADKDGLMEGEQHNTYDIEFYGPNPLTSIIYLGALRAGEEMAQALGETAAAAEYRRIYESGARKAVAKLWNGEYFEQVVPAGEDKPHQFGKGCLSDQVLGQWMAHVTGLGYLLPRENMRKAIEAVYRHNYKKSLRGLVNTCRVYALQEEGGLLACTWPRGGRQAAPFPYADEVWTGMEYHVAAHLIYEGLVAPGLEIVRAVRARHDGVRRNPFNEPECGNHYVRGLSSWSLLLALSGFRWSAPEETLRFVPALPGKRFRCFYSNGHAWGTASEGRSGRKALVSFSVEGGTLAVKRLKLSPDLTRLDRVWTEPSRTFLKGTLSRRREESLVEFSDSVKLNAGQALVLSFST